MRTLPLLLIPALALFTGCSADDTIDTIENTQLLSAIEVSDLQFLREEEKLAHDVYTYAYEKYGLNIFNNIASSEQTHTDAVLNLMIAYGIVDSATNQIGTFNNAELAALYTELIAKVNTSFEDALLVGATIEDLDIFDLDEKAMNTSSAEIENLYSNLKCGSENHMRAFTNQLNNYAVSYTPTYIDAGQYEAILAGSNGGCGN